MEDFPVEVIGNILSQVETPRVLVVASKTCRKWQEAWRKHLHTLAFNSYDWYDYNKLRISELEVIITQIIAQTTALQCLSIIFKGVKFSKVSVSAWIMCTRDTLSQLHYSVATKDLNILEICGRQRLELLDLGAITITSFDPTYQMFPCLRFLSLYRVKISTLNLSCWLSACPKVEILNLVDVDFGKDSPQMSMKVSSNSLKDIHVKSCKLRKFTLKSNSLEKLQLTDCNIPTFKLKDQEKLRILVLDGVISSLKVCNIAENIEIVIIRFLTTSWFDFNEMIVKLSKARRMSLYGILLEDDNNEIVMRKTTSAWFPQLTHLSLSFELGQTLHNGLLGNRLLENVVEVELHWRSSSYIKSHLVVDILKRCPNLRKLIIEGCVSVVETPEECGIFAEFTNFIMTVSRKYKYLQIQFLCRWI